MTEESIIKTERLFNANGMYICNFNVKSDIGSENIVSCDTVLRNIIIHRACKSPYLIASRLLELSQLKRSGSHNSQLSLTRQSFKFSYILSSLNNLSY